MIDPQARRLLGTRLREVRETAGLNGKQLAAKLNWYGASRVSKIELGQQVPSLDDLAAWTVAVGRPEMFGELAAMLHGLADFYQPWPRYLALGLQARQNLLAALEADAASIRVFAPAAIPELLQIPEYAHARLAHAVEFHRLADTAEQAVVALRHRQDIMHKPGKQFHFVLTDAALRAPLADREIMAAQLGRLRVLSTVPGVRLGTLPPGTPLEPLFACAFTVLDDRLVLADTPAAELRLAQPGDITAYRRVFDFLAQRAAYEQQARRQTARAQGDLSPSALEANHRIIST